MLFVFTSCNNDANQGKEIVAVQDSGFVVKDTVNKVKAFQNNMVIGNIPFPFEILDKLYEEHSLFEEQIMNDVSNASKYNQISSKALNLGVYGADLAYVVTFEQFQQIGMYIKVTKKIAEDLGIPLAFNQETMDKYNKYRDNKDSLTQIVFNSYNEVDKALKINERQGMAALVVAGSWLEGLYITAKTYPYLKTAESKTAVFEKVKSQKIHLENIMKSLLIIKGEKSVTTLLNDLNEVKVVFDNFQNESNEAQNITSLFQKLEKIHTKIVEGL